MLFYRTVSVLTIVIGMFSISSDANALSSSEREYQLKSAFISNFIRYTRWTPPPADHFQFCTTSDSVNKILSLNLSKERWFELSPSFRVVSPGQEQACHFLFVDHDSDKAWQPHLSTHQVENLLIVSEKQGAARTQSQINFFLADNKLRFEINPKRLELTKLKVSSSLLRLARIVENNANKGTM